MHPSDQRNLKQVVRPLLAESGHSKSCSERPLTTQSCQNRFPVGLQPFAGSEEQMKTAISIGLLAVTLGATTLHAEQAATAITPYNNILKRSTLLGENAQEVQMREILFAPGWNAPRHYHNSDLFIYVIEGDFEVDMEGEGLKTYTNGQALRMKPNTAMDARNPSRTKPLKLAVFQVGNPDAPFVVPVENQK